MTKAVIRFQLYGAMGHMDCHALRKYHRYWLDKEKKLKNEKFDRDSGYILSMKTLSNRDFMTAMSYYAKLTGELIDELLGRLGFGSASLVVVPSSKAGKPSEGVERMAKKVAAGDKRLSFLPGALVRTKDISKRSHGGDRSLQMNLNSLELKTKKLAPLVFVLDDVSTSGNSLVACEHLIHRVNEQIKVVGLVLGKTADD